MTTSPHPRARGERGASSVEYGLILVGIAAVIVAIVLLLGGQVTDMFNDTCENIRDETGNGECQDD